jgi:hypothetical protein
LKWLTTLDLHDEKGRRGRWMEFIGQYEMEIVHKPGKSPEMSMADYLSRIVKEGFSRTMETSSEEKGNLCGMSKDKPLGEVVVSVSLEQIKQAQLACSTLREVYPCSYHRGYPFLHYSSPLS